MIVYISQALGSIRIKKEYNGDLVETYWWLRTANSSNNVNNVNNDGNNNNNNPNNTYFGVRPDSPCSEIIWERLLYAVREVKELNSHPNG